MANERIIFETLTGSHVYGTNVATSDKDYKGIVIPDSRSILLQTALRTRNNASKKEEGLKNGPEDCDREFFSFHYFMKLLLDGQTHPVEMLFIPRDFWLKNSDEWEQLVGFRHLLISKKLTAFVGYAKNQANKYSAKGERLATVQEIVKRLQDRKGDQLLKDIKHVLFDIVEYYPKHARFVDIDNMGHIRTHIEVCGRKIDLDASVRYALDCYELVLREYGERAKASVEGVDWKAVAHAVRIAEEAIEILETEIISFPRPNAKFLLEIRTGMHSYDSIMEYFDTLLVKIEEASKITKLKETPHTELANYLVASAYAAAINEGLV